MLNMQKKYENKVARAKPVKVIAPQLRTNQGSDSMASK